MLRVSATLLLELLFCFSARASALDPVPLSCETTLAPVTPSARDIFAGYISLPSGSKLFTRIEVPIDRPPRGFVMPLHGLLDSHRTWDQETALLVKEGYGVIRPDLRGFARSLHDQHALPDVIPARENARDIRELLIYAREHFHIEKPRLVGHSMAGALVVSVLSDPRNRPLLDHRHVLISTYVYRGERYEFEKLSAVNPWAAAWLQSCPESVMDRYMSEPFMRKHFPKFTKEVLKSRGVDLPYAEMCRLVERQIDMAIATTKGLRETDLLVDIKDVPPDLTIDQVFGNHDEVVAPRLLRQLGELIIARGGRSIEIKGGHMLTLEAPGQLVDLIVDP